MRFFPDLAAAALIAACAQAAPAPAASAQRAVAVVAGGCFWCTEADFDKLPGVLSTTSGYTGGKVANPTYEQVSGGDTGHIEALRIVYDPSKTSYAKLVAHLLRTVDPLDLGGQFCDRGYQYRSAVFVADAHQRRIAQASKARAAAVLKKPVATLILPAANFYLAEDYHQDYYKKNSTKYRFYRWNCGRDKRLAEVWGGKNKRARPTRLRSWRHTQRLDWAKFRDPLVTAKGERRAHVALDHLETLWINTGTLCNLTCRNCYIESSPTNDALVYLSLAEVEAYLDEAQRLGTREIGFTGGEPFMNRDAIPMIRSALERGFDVLVLTNAMRPMRRFDEQIGALLLDFRDRLTMRVSLDHYSKAVHEAERGPGSWDKAIDGLRWLAAHNAQLAVAGRHMVGEGEAQARAGYARLFDGLGVAIGAFDPSRWCCSRKWTQLPTCRRSPRPAGASSECRRAR